jgi:hypothetical protein
MIEKHWKLTRALTGREYAEGGIVKTDGLKPTIREAILE